MESNSHNTSSVPGRVNDPQTLARFASIKSYDDYVKDKNNPVVMVTLTLGDQPFLNKNHFETFLTQHTNAHDEFTIVVSDTAIDDFYGQVMKNSKNLLGEKITIHFHQKGNIIQSFKGIIANICNKKNEGGGYGNLYISGFAPSILLDSGKECQSYENKTLKEIVTQATEEYKEVTINTDGLLNTKYQIPYVVQYKESDYQFIQRLARRYGEFFYYNGTQLMFNNETQKTVTLLEGGDLINVEFELMIKPQNFSYISYDVETGNTEQKTTQEVHLQDKINPFQYTAIKASEKVFTKKPTIPYNAISEQFRGDYLKDVVRREKESREQLMQVRGKSRNPHLRIGGFIKLKDINDKPMESYRIIDIKHHQSGYDYENEFIAIPDVYIAYYYDEQALPRAEQQVARVTDNNDPKGLGRVRVQFIWQEKHQTKTPWIRVVQPHAGGGKGFYFIPEIGEEVWVDFEDQNAERPFVVGSNYNGKEFSPFHNTNNDIKAIQTRSGHKLVFTEDESILLSDKNGNTLRFDTQGKNIEISAPESISLCAGKDLNLSAGNNLVMDVANTAFFNILQQMLVTTPFMKQLIADYFHTQAGKALINSDQEIKIEARETNVAGTEKLLVHSDRNATLNSKGVLSVKGEQGNKYTNKAEEYEVQDPTPIVENAIAIVHFRPKEGWKGEFGFDWFREKTDFIKDSENYQELIGKYYIQDPKKEFRKYEKRMKDPNYDKSQDILNNTKSMRYLFIADSNSWYIKTDSTNSEYFKLDPQFFEKDNSLEKLKNEYIAFKYYKESKKKREILPYYASYITLFPKTENYGINEAEIQLNITNLDDKVKPDYFVFKIGNQELDENHIHPLIDIDKLKIRKEDIKKGKVTIKITCKAAKDFDENRCIEILAVKEEKRTLAGCLIMIAPKIKEIDVVLVSTKVYKGFGNINKHSNWKTFFKNLAGQALIKVNFIENDVKGKLIEIDISRLPNKPYKMDSNGTIIDKTGLAKVLKTELDSKYPECNGKLILFFLDTDSTEVGGFYDETENVCMIFSNHTIETIPHEFLHSQGLPHSFFVNNPKRFVFKAMETHNIMDYSHIIDDPITGKERTPKDRYYTWFWQWRIVNNNIKEK